MNMDARIQAIIKAKDAQKLTNQQLADMCDISESTVSRTLAKKTAPTLYTISVIEEFLGITEKPVDDPIVEKLTEEDPLIGRYLDMLEDRISRMRGHYNMLLAEKNRWIKLLFVLTIILAVTLVTFLVLDILHPDIGWMRHTATAVTGFMSGFNLLMLIH